MTDLERLIAAVEAGKYERPSGTPRYYDFGEDSSGILPGSRMDRMGVYLGGKEAALSRLRAALAQTPTDPGDGWTWNERLGWIGPDGKPAGRGGA